MLTSEETENLARRVGDLLSNDSQFAAAVPDRAVSEAILTPDISWRDLIATLCEGYADRPALGERVREIVTVDGRRSLRLRPAFDTITYGQLWQRVKAVAATLAQGGVRAGDRVATLGFCSADYTTIDMAIAVLSAVSVPLHAGAPATSLHPMVAETEPTVIACSGEYVDTGVALALQSTASTLLVFDYCPDVDAHREALSSASQTLGASTAGTRLETITDVIERGGDLPDASSGAVDESRLAAIIYTSGSSGSPKGAMQPESLARSIWTMSAAMLVERGFALPAISLNYMPMSHTAGRAMLYQALGAGGTAYFAGASDLSTIIDDLALVRPTQLNFVPRIWEMLYHEYSTELRRRGAGSEVAVLADMRSRTLGGRYISALTGSAPISAELAAWVERLLDGHLMNAFGATESGSVLIDGRVQRPPVTDYKLADVPELGYFSTDRPHPRGELLIKSRTLFQGYYKRPNLTAEVFDEDGFYRTGDVVAELGPDELAYVDRRNNVIKLAQGEFVTVSKLEALYSACELIHQIYVYGNSEQSYLLAVVVPTEQALADHDISEIKSAVLQSMRQAARRADLEPYEVPRDIVIEPRAFTLDNGLLSGIRKPSRPNLKAHYGAQLEQLYAELAEAQNRRLRELADDSAQRSIVETVCGLAGSLCGDSGEDPSPDAHFTDLGGDSLSAVTFANALEEIYRVAVPVGFIISPASDLGSVADYIEDARRADTRRPTFASVHGARAREVSADQLTLDNFIDPGCLASAADFPAVAGSPRCVLLTGATGYLGRYLLLEWLDRMAAVDGTVFCLVRGKDAVRARERLDAVFDTGDRELLARYTSLATTSLEVVAGDKSQPRLGVDSQVWQRLADDVDLIVDSAALVNHMLPYGQLFGPNVVGTAELITLALSSRRKPYAYVSTIGVGATIEFGQFTEDADIRRIGSTRTIDDSYANGYATSKWAGEVLLRDAFDLFGLPVSVFRCDMLMAETKYRGQLNVGDMVTRLLFSIAATGLAPASFYVGEAKGGRPRAHFDGLPVDFVAEAICTLAVTLSDQGYHTFHVINPHDDGIGLDEYVDWMIEAGCAIERLSDYTQWVSRFETALRNLPEPRRQASLLPLLVSFAHPQPALTGAFAPTQRFAEAVAEHRIGTGGEIPHIDRDVITKYVTDLEHLGLLDAGHRQAPPASPSDTATENVIA